MRRPGGITLEQLREVVPEIQLGVGQATADQAQLAPGQLLRHYAPRAPLTLYEGEPGPVVARMAADARTAVAAGDRVGILAPDEDVRALAPDIAAAASAGRVITRAYGSRTDPARAARELFAALRELDEADVTVILASGPADEGLGAAIRDRLFRAAEGRLRKA